MTDKPEAFNLRELIRATMADSVVADPGVLADLVFLKIAKKDRDEALAQSLRTFVRQVFSEGRLTTYIDPSGRVADVQPVRVQPGRSAKVAGIREHWQRALRDPINVGAGLWKLLGDCTATDLFFVADFRREQASRNTAKAAQYDALRALLDDHSVDRVRDLPTSILAASLARVA